MSLSTVLDHGYVVLIESWGSDERVIEAARMSTGKGFQGWGPTHGDPCSDGYAGQSKDPQPYPCCKPVAGDEKLLRFLYENKHHTPFEMAGAIVEVKAPIFVFREWHRHRVPFSYNEMSSRYTPLPDENYIPTVERLLINSKTNKQAGVVAGATELTSDKAEFFRASLRALYTTAEGLYQEALLAGVPKELARVHLPVGRYSRMRASSNIRGWMNFMTLRSASAAQFEIRVYSQALHDILAEKFPRTIALFDEGTAR